MEVTALAIGVLPIAAQLFQSTLALYSQYLESQDMGSTSQKYRTFLQIERHRYENFGAYIGLSRGNSTLPLPPATFDLILDIFAHIARVLLAAQKLERKYSFPASTGSSQNPTSVSTPPSSVEPLSSSVTRRLENHAVLAEEVRRSVSLRLSVKFVVWDKSKFEQFLLDLRNFNDGLESVTGYQPHLRSQLIVQMLDVQEAQVLSALSRATENVYPTLSEMARRKASYLDMRDRQKQEISGGANHPSTTSELRLNYGDLSIRKETHPSGRTFGSYKGVPIMIEWKILGDELSCDQSMISRIEDMSIFLSRSSTIQDDVLSPSHLLGCIGYSLKPGETQRVAIIYKTSDTKHTTLHNMINDQQHADLNLGTRFRLALSLASCVFYLHLTGWLHKGLRSSNIIIRGDSSQNEHGTKALRAYLAGFSTARLEAAEISEKIETDAHSDLYQHPRYQSTNKDENRYTRQYDIYSLGMILLELGSWQLIETSGNYKPKGYNPSRFLNRLLKGPVESLSFTMGNSFKRAVIWCLQGQFEKKDPEPEFTSLSDSEMSTVFWEKVVLELVRSSVEE
ncbi:prion-inhibition and propagation-domain-containing protein [Morchella snyderi]|nr:prion-inhibition and propagation-domain-containing protein [Morchella snyderi]